MGSFIVPHLDERRSLLGWHDNGEEISNIMQTAKLLEENRRGRTPQSAG